MVHGKVYVYLGNSHGTMLREVPDVVIYTDRESSPAGKVRRPPP